MREAIGGTWLMGIVIFFIVLFSGILAVSVNYAKAFTVKNGIINIIEKDRGHTEATRDKIEDYLKEIGYSVYGSCTLGGVCRGTGELPGTGSNKYKYCINKHNVKVNAKETYYTVTVFFKVDLPIFFDVFTFPVFGQTKTIIWSSGTDTMGENDSCPT